MSAHHIDDLSYNEANQVSFAVSPGPNIDAAAPNVMSPSLADSNIPLRSHRGPSPSLVSLAVERPYHNSVEVTPFVRAEQQRTVATTHDAIGHLVSPGSPAVDADDSDPIPSAQSSASKNSKTKSTESPPPPNLSEPYAGAVEFAAHPSRYRHSQLRLAIESYELDSVKSYLLANPSAVGANCAEPLGNDNEPAVSEVNLLLDEPVRGGRSGGESGESGGESEGGAVDYQSPLSTAARCGCLAVVSLLVTQYADRLDVDRANGRGQTALWIACHRNYIAIVSLLLNSGKADVSKADNEGQTPLFVACAQDNTAVINLLLKHGQQQRKLAFLDVREGGYESALSSPVRVSDECAHTVDVTGRSVLFAACQYNRSATVRLLCKQPEFLELINLPRHNGDAPLAVACLHGHRDIIKILLSVGSDQGEGGATATGATATPTGEGGIGAGAAVGVTVHLDATNGDGDSALHLVCRQQAVDLAALLIEHGASTITLDDCGQDALQYISDEEDRRMLAKAGTGGRARGRTGLGLEHWVGSCGYSLYTMVEGGLGSLQSPNLLTAASVLGVGWGLGRGSNTQRAVGNDAGAADISGSAVTHTHSPMSGQQSLEFHEEEDFSGSALDDER